MFHRASPVSKVKYVLFNAPDNEPSFLWRSPGLSRSTTMKPKSLKWRSHLKSGADIYTLFSSLIHEFPLNQWHFHQPQLHLQLAIVSTKDSYLFSIRILVEIWDAALEAHFLWFSSLSNLSPLFLSYSFIPARCPPDHFCALFSFSHPFFCILSPHALSFHLLVSLHIHPFSPWLQARQTIS